MDETTRSKRKQVSSLSALTQSVLLTALYFVGGLLGHAGSFLSGEVALIWPPAGIAVAAILILGYRFWPAVAAGAVLFSTVSGKPFGFFTFATAIGNTISAISCAYLLQNIAGFRPSLARLRDATGFILLAAAVGTTINAAFNVVGLCYAGLLSWNQMFPSVLQWWVPNALGTLLVAPLILAWANGGVIRWNLIRALELAACTAGVAVSCAISFDSWVFHGLYNYPMAFLPFPFLVWAALRFDQRGGTTAVAIVAACAVAELLQHRGPFFTGNETTSLMLIGCYIGIASSLTLLLAGGSMERHEALLLLETSEKRYRGVVEDQFDLICRFRPDGTLTFVNDAYCRFYNRSTEELLGTNFFRDLREDDREIPLAVFHALTPNRSHVSFDNRTFVENKITWQQLTVRAFFDASGQISGFQGVMQDITDRKESEERLKAILHTITSGVIVVHPPGFISSLNPAAESIFGRQAQDVIGLPLATLFSGSDVAVLDEHLNNIGRRGRKKYFESGAVTPDGKVVPIEVAVTETTVSRVRMQIVMVRDVSERKQLEVQSQKMEAIGRLTGGIAHDFNNLTQALLGYSTILSDRLSERDPNRDTAKQIKKTVEQATALTRQLLTFSRQQEPVRKVVAMNEVVSEMNSLLKRWIGSNIRLHLKLYESHLFVSADPGQVQQILMNLAINARDAMFGSGELTIKTEPFSLEAPDEGDLKALKPGDYTLLCVTDTGCGMTPEVKARIFEAFFTTKEAGKGTGLGLSIVHSIVQQLGGLITVDSTPGVGTSFNVYLPRVEGEMTVTQGDEPLKTENGGETILLVEDEELVRDMFEAVLQSKGFKVLTAGDGLQALKVSNNYADKIHLMITDMNLPELSGSQLAERIAKARGAMPVLYISGYSSDDATHKLSALGTVDFLQKPFAPETLLTKIRCILERSSPRKSSARSEFRTQPMDESGATRLFGEVGGDTERSRFLNIAGKG